MKILTLDLATVTGWACGSHHPGPVSHGVLKLPWTGDDIGEFLNEFRRWLGAMIEQFAPGEIVFEAPLLLRHDKARTLRKLYGVCGLTELVGRDYGIVVCEAGLNDIRKHFIGTAQAPKSIKTKSVRRRWLKDKTVAEARARGFRVADDNDADALALLSYALALKQPGFILRSVCPRCEQPVAAGARHDCQPLHAVGERAAA